MANGDNKAWYKKPLWISLMTVGGALIVIFEICRGCSSFVVGPIEASVNKHIYTIADTVSKANDAPIKRTLHKIKIEQLRATAYQEASMTREQLDVGRSKFKRDSIRYENDE